MTRQDHINRYEQFGERCRKLAQNMGPTLGVDNPVVAEGIKELLAMADQADACAKQIRELPDDATILG